MPPICRSIWRCWRASRPGGGLSPLRAAMSSISRSIDSMRSSLRNKRSINCLRPSKVAELIHASPPGQPLTLGGENTFCPSSALAITNGRRFGASMSNCFNVPITNSTGDLISAARLSVA